MSILHRRHVTFSLMHAPVLGVAIVLGATLRMCVLGA